MYISVVTVIKTMPIETTAVYWLFQFFSFRTKQLIKSWLYGEH